MMKKKLFAFLFAGALALSSLALPAPAAFAAEQCDCHNWSPITGADRNVAVAGLLSSDAFKDVKSELLSTGNSFNGAYAIEVINPFPELMMIGVPFTSPDGTVYIHAFINGMYAGSVPQ